MRIISINVNGIRAAARKGFFDWLRYQRADIVCIQELKAQVDQLQDPVFWPKSFHCHYYPARKKGYSGVAIYTRSQAEQIIHGFGVKEFDDEGRYIEARINGMACISLYMPSGSSAEHRQASKDRFLKVFPKQLAKLKKTCGEVVVCGDFNIAHREIDLKNWKSNQKNSGFLPHERAWLDKLYGESGYTDAYRVIEPEKEQYTWWSNRGQARANNVGWRIDYQAITPGLVNKVRKARVYTDKWFSDHAPLIIDYDA